LLVLTLYEFGRLVHGRFRKPKNGGALNGQGASGLRASHQTFGHLRVMGIPRMFSFLRQQKRDTASDRTGMTKRAGVVPWWFLKGQA
jgi:hypothetical protein